MECIRLPVAYFTAAIAIFVAAGFVTLSFLQQHWSGWLIAFPVAAHAIYLVIVTRDPHDFVDRAGRVALCPFSTRIVPWSEIVAVAAVRGEERGVA
jgi:hypothetical protein